MKKFISILFVFFSYSSSFSQTTIDLKIVPFEIANQNFYIDNVIDNRQELHLGVIENKSNKKVTLRFENGTATTIKNFMDAALPKSGDRVPITLRVNHLKIEEAQTSIDKRTARVYIELHFYAENGEELYKVVHYEDQVFPVSNLSEIYETHEQRIRAALEYCLWSFINAQKVNTTHNLIKDDVLDNANSTKKASTFEAYVPLGKWVNMLTFQRVTDKYNEGWNVEYTGFSDNDKDLIIPFVIGFGQSKSKSDIVRERGYSSVDSYVLGFGFNGFIKITPGVYVDLGLNVPLGLEVLRDLEDNKSTNFLIGLSANQGVKIIPWKDFGIVIGAGIFQRWQTSKVINRNFGFALELGINF
ncbi:hypothetical protein ES692_00580 [Psychroserpens burtonensis]|uniref:Uncharacterized protein n=1 Tax=Psychroserpens burtonensis TaxID=49278 RepID=A0A5C7BKY0_9FLAO|nr:hypothetical protein [Psychroserpens burtonensis]TXE20319.1 hypothetical protein ES692_00580 [Psychroserpens burtonensis]